MPDSFVHTINVVVAFIEFVIVVLMVHEARRLRGGKSSVILGLGVFFLIDALITLNRSEVIWHRSESFIFATGLDVLALLVLVVVFLNARRIAEAAVAIVDMAGYRAREYERARRDYTQVVRHRILNPVTIIRGAAVTLDANDSLDAATRHELLRAIIDSSKVIENVSLEPERLGFEEHGLEATPRIEE